jgi:hypothetical protein
MPWGCKFGSDEEPKVVDEGEDDSVLHDESYAHKYPRFFSVIWFIQVYNECRLLEAFVLEFAKVCTIEDENESRDHDPVYNYEAVLHPG